MNRNALLPIVMCAALAACTETPITTEAPLTLTPAFSYGSPGCEGGTAEQICQFYYFGSDATATGYCLYGDCFKMTNGEEFKIVAARGRDEFPAVWYAWGGATLSATSTGIYPCVVTQDGKKKTRVEIPVGEPRCSASATAGEYTYHEIFASNAASQCLGWVECRVSTVIP